MTRHRIGLALLQRRKRALVFVPPTRTSRVSRRLRGIVLTAGRVIAAIAVLSGTLFGVSLAVQPARAEIQCDLGLAKDPTNLGPEKLNAGTTAWVPFLAKEDIRQVGGDNHPTRFGAQQNPNDYTLWEVVGPRGLKWSYAPQALKPEKVDNFDRVNPESNFDDKCSAVDVSGVMIAQMIWEFSRFLAGISIGLKQIASADAPFAPFYGTQSTLIDKLRDQLFIPALALGVMVTGFWVALRMHRREESRETYAGVLGGAVIVIALVVVLFGGNYQALTAAIDKYTSDFNSAVLNTLVDPNAEKEALSPCYLPAVSLTPSASAQSVPDYFRPPDDRESPAHLTYNRGKRISSCMLYKLLLFDPWKTGQFGTSEDVLAPDLHYNTDQEKDPNGYCTISPYRCVNGTRPSEQVNLAIQQVIAQGYTRNETITQKTDPVMDRQEYPPAIDPPVNRLQLWKAVQYGVADHNPQFYSSWKGSDPTGRMATAIGAAVMNLIILIAIGFIAVLTIFWHGVLFVAWILLPVVAAVAIFPPARRILRAVLGIMVQAVFLRNVFGLVLAVLLGVMSAIQVGAGSTAMKIILMIIAALAIWKLLSALRSGALSPQVAQEAAQMGVLPSDEGVDRTFRRARVGAAGMAASTARTAGRRAYGTWAGGREAAATARAESSHDSRSAEYRQEVATARKRGRAQGGRAATSLGRMRQQAETQAITRTQRDMRYSRLDKEREEREGDEMGQGGGQKNNRQDP